MLLLSFKNAWDSVMLIDRNPLRHLPLTTAHPVMQILAWMWSTVFSLAVGSYFAFGVTAVAHSLAIAGVFVTFAVVRSTRAQAPVRNPAPRGNRYP